MGLKVEVRMDMKGCEEDDTGDWLTKTNYVGTNIMEIYYLMGYN